MRGEDEILAGIRLAANKHPNSRVSKLIRGVEEEPTQKNIVLLLIELAEATEYATDFGISLKYYLELFERLGIGKDIVLNEAGLLLLSSSKIYSRRVDFVQELVECQILTLSNADREITAANEQKSSSVAEKPKRGRKRLVEAPNDPYEVELLPKKIRKLSEEKRFTNNKAKTKGKLMSTQRNVETEQYIHPAVWMHSSIVDLENDEEIDSKRNYKLFTYHVEHRYNTLVPDINFRLHFKVKDYIDEQEERLEEECREKGINYIPEEATASLWPPLSDEYVQKYLSLENHILEREMMPDQKLNWLEQQVGQNQATCALNESKSDLSTHCSDDSINATTEKVQEIPTATDFNALEQVQNNNTESTITNESQSNDSGLGNSLLDATTVNANSTLPLNEQEIANETLPKPDGEHNLSVSENSILEHVQNLNSTEITADSLSTSAIESYKSDSGLGNSLLDATSKSLDESLRTNESTTHDNSLLTDENSKCDLGLGNSLLDATSKSLDESLRTNDSTTHDNSLNADESLKANESTISAFDMEKSLNNTENDSGLSESLTEPNQTQNASISIVEETGADVSIVANLDIKDSDIVNSLNKEIDATIADQNSTIKIDLNSNSPEDHTQINLNEIRVILPHLDDEGVYFSDLDDHEHRLLSPVVIATDVLPAIPNKKNITIVVDDEIKALLNIMDDEPETYLLPIEMRVAAPPILLNIFKIPEKILKRRVLFKLGPDMNLYLQARSLKRTRTTEPRAPRLSKMMKWFSLSSTDMTGIQMTPANSPTHGNESDFCGFSDIDDTDDTEAFLGFSDEDDLQRSLKNILNTDRLSRDSGMGADVLTPGKIYLDAINEEANTDSVSLQISSNDIECSKRDLFNDDSNPNINDALSKEPTMEAQVDDKENACTSEGNIDANTENIKEQNSAVSKTDDIVTTDVTNITETESAIETVKQSSIESSTNTETVDKDASTNNSNETKCISSPSEESICDIQLNLNKLKEVIASDDDSTSADDFDIAIDKELQFELNASKTKIQQWHEHLQPILAKSRERHHFDVFQIGTEIIDEMHMDNSTKAITFEDVMANKDATYVSRYFLSSLLLANQNNIQININNKSSEQPSAWNDIQFELISTKRHTVAIEDNIGMISSTKSKTKSAPPVKRLALQANASSSTSTVCNEISETIEPVSSQPKRLAMESEVLNVNLNVVKPLKHIEKLPRNSDDYDSGIFSSEEFQSS